MLLLPDQALEQRRAVCGGPLSLLTDSLRADLQQVIQSDLYVPPEKALLSKAGGRCESDGTQLEFNPFAPRKHRCPRCGAAYTGEFHDRWWVYPYQLWLAERAVHGAALGVLTGDGQCSQLSAQVLDALCERYIQYPNVDNVLGPTRLFFSTYLESIWLLQICIASDLMRLAGHDVLRDRVIDQIVEPSRALIEQYDEGMSNRQVWNNAALLGSAIMTDDRAGVERIVENPSGVRWHLSRGLLQDGTWYEGDNYHQFAHRGLWYCVTMLEAAGFSLPEALAIRFNEGFLTPYMTALPDFTFPSRKDSQYAVSLRQWRFAEFAELGYTRTEDERLAGVLGNTYDENQPEGDTRRSRSTADVEFNCDAVRLSRADLGWRSLLFAVGDLPSASKWRPGSVHLIHQGITVLRRRSPAGTVYAALDWGQCGGGHGHPDRLNVLLATGNHRWLDDFGTGSYVEDLLHWYRSTLAHNAPMVDGRSQPLTDGSLLAFEETGNDGWALAALDLVDVHIERAIVVADSYMIDELTWFAGRDVDIAIPLHFDPSEVSGVWEAPSSEPDLEAMRFVTRCDKLAESDEIVRMTAHGSNGSLNMWFDSDPGAAWFRMTGPGTPGGAERPFVVAQSSGSSGRLRAVRAWDPAISDVRFESDEVIVSVGDRTDLHRRLGDEWRIDRDGVAISLGGSITHTWKPDPAIRPAPQPEVLPVGPEPLQFELGGNHYRRSEQTWEEAECPTAAITLAVHDGCLKVEVTARTGEVVFVPEDALNPYDNEAPDINGDGVQVYFLCGNQGGGWLAVPEARSDAPRVRRLAQWGAERLATARSKTGDNGFEMSFAIQLPEPAATGETPFGFDLIVNETRPGRARRRGQLVLSGARGEFVYLRGDRHDPSRLFWFKVVNSL